MWPYLSQFVMSLTWPPTRGAGVMASPLYSKTIELLTNLLFWVLNFSLAPSLFDLCRSQCLTDFVHLEIFQCSSRVHGQNLKKIELDLCDVVTLRHK